jgi:hypothetical protein
MLGQFPKERCCLGFGQKPDVPRRLLQKPHAGWPVQPFPLQVTSPQYRPQHRPSPVDRHVAGPFGQLGFGNPVDQRPVDVGSVPSRPRSGRAIAVWACEQIHDYVLFMVNTGLHPDEAARLEYRDVEIVADKATGETILEMSVRGKRGVGYCKSMPGAVLPFKVCGSATSRNLQIASFQ